MGKKKASGTADYNFDNIVAPATAVGAGAIGIIRLSGADAITIADAVFVPYRHPGKKSAKLKTSESYKLIFGKVTEDSKLIDECLAAVFRAPNSYTGENCVEFYTHASSYIMEKIQRMLLEVSSKLLKDNVISAPLRLAHAGEFTQRAFLNGKMDLAQAEAVADLIASETEASHDIAINQMRGGFSSELRNLRQSLLSLCSLIELELDFFFFFVEFADRAKLSSLLTATYVKIKDLADSFALGNVIKNGIPVAIVGAVNTGKSTLLNLMLGEERAIVSPIQGTTRDTVEDNINISGTLFRFIDTAGIRNTTETIEMMGIERTFQKLKESSVIILMLDATRETSISPALLSIAEKINPKRQQLVIIANKTDKLAKNVSSAALEKMIKDECRRIKLKPKEIIATSLKKTPEEAKAKLVSALSSIGKGYTSDIQGKTYVTNLRHYQALKDAQASIERVFDGLDNNLPTDLLAQDLREATDDLGSIIGEISSQDVLNNIFANFCIGK